MTSTAKPYASTDGREVLVDVVGHVATVTLNRPSRYNAITPASLELLSGELQRLSDDPEVRVVVITGAGKAFSSGGDMEALGVGAMTPEFVRSGVRVVEMLHGLRPVTIAAVNGACAGGGMSLACAADLRFAAESSFFTAAYLRIGTPGDMGLPWHLVRLVGESKAKELSLMCERVAVPEAASIGLVNRVIPDDSFQDTVAELARRIAGFAPLATSLLKRNLNEATATDLGSFLDVESERFARNSFTADAAEAVRAFVEKCEPVYTGH